MFLVLQGAVKSSALQSPTPLANFSKPQLPGEREKRIIPIAKADAFSLLPPRKALELLITWGNETEELSRNKHMVCLMENSFPSHYSSPLGVFAGK